MGKKILSLLLSAALCAGIALPASACKDFSASGNGENTEQTPGGSQGGNNGSQGSQGGSGSGNQGSSGE